MSQNPLVIPILDILKQSVTDLGEYDIIQALEKNGFHFPFENETYEMRMFKKHFMTMNALYYLQNDLIKENLYLSITPLKINIQSISDSTDMSALVDNAEHKIREYYLDWSQFDKTGQDEVEKLLNSFWEKYLAQDKLVEALSALDVHESSDWQLIQTSYRRLVLAHHPDKGGDHSRFIEIREAYEVLKRYHQR